MSDPPAIELRSVKVERDGIVALDGIDLAIPRGQRVAVVGPSGAGKTTLLGVCNGTLRPTSGSATVLGADLHRHHQNHQRDVRSRIGTVHQQLALVASMRVIHNVNAGRLGRWTRRRALWSLVRPRGRREVEAALGDVGLDPSMSRARTDTLSVGQQQRVAIARLLVQEPELILADEPVSSLDPARAADVLGLLSRLAGDHDRTLLVSLHAYDLALAHFDRIVGLRDGVIRFDCAPSEISPAETADLYRLGASS